MKTNQHLIHLPAQSVRRFFLKGIKILFQIRKQFGYMKILLIFTTSQIVYFRHKFQYVISDKNCRSRGRNQFVEIEILFSFGGRQPEKRVQSETCAQKYNRRSDRYFHYRTKFHNIRCLSAKCKNNNFYKENKTFAKYFTGNQRRISNPSYAR